MESHSAPPHPSDELLETLLTISLTGVIFFEPVYSQDGTHIIDLAYVRLNPAAQQKLQLPEHPTETFLTLYPHALETGIFAFYRDTFLSGKAGRYDVNYSHDGLDNYFRLSAKPAGRLLVVSFDDTAHQPRTAVEVALRESEAREKAARAQLQALNEELTTANEELRASYEELQAANQELLLTRTALEALNRELEERVAKRTFQLQQAQQEIGRQKDRLERFFRQAPACICVLDGEELVFELVNPAFQQFYPGRELLGKSVGEALPEIAQGPFYAILQQVYHTGKTFEGKEVLFPVARYPGGPVDELYFNFIYQARLDEQGKVDGILAFGYEVTQQALARQKVNESEELFRTFANNIQNLAWMAEPDGWIYWYNQQWYDYTGTTLEQMQGWGWEKVHHPDHLDRVVAFVREAWQKGETWELTFPLKGADGDYRWFITRAYAVKNDKGGVMRWIGTNTDIDAQKRAQVALLEREKEAQTLAQELAAANEELQAANEEIRSTNEELGISNATLTRTNADLNRVNQDLDNFVYTASHDLKAPILNIEGLLKALERQLGREQLGQESVQQIYGLLYGSVNRFKETIQDLTEVARIGKESPEDVDRVVVADVLAEVLEDLEPQIREASARLECSLDCSPIQFSKKNLKSILYNLLSNAIKYRSLERELQVSITCHMQRDYHLLTVQDNGLGMDMRQEEKIFGLFKRLHAHVEGTGIGLYIVKKMIENAGGRIQVESQVGVGSRFKVYFKQ